MRYAVIVSTARTPITKAFSGALNRTPAPTLCGISISAAVARANVLPEEVEDCVIGCALQQGMQFNIGRTAALVAGLGVKVAGMSVDRQCASGLMAIGVAAKQIVADEMDICVAGGVESISTTQINRLWVEHDPSLLALHKDYAMSMIDTANRVARRYKIDRARCDAYSLQSHVRAAEAQRCGLFNEEIVQVDLQAWADEQVDGEKSDANLLLTVDEGVRPGTNIEELAKLKPAGAEGSIVTAGNASQRSDGASACVIMEETLAEKKGLAPLGRYIGTAVSGLEPDEMGIGPAVAIPRLLQRFGVTPDQVGLWEINESFAAPVLHCRDVLQIPDERLNVNGGAISLGHPYGMSGARIAAHALLEGRRRKARYVVASASVGGGIGAACLLEVL